MWSKKILSLLQNIINCRIEESKVFPFTSSEKILYRLIISYKGCIRIYINDVKVPKKNSYVCTQYENTNSIKIRIRGLFNSKTIFIPLDSSSHFDSLILNFPAVNKAKILINKEIKYKAIKRYRLLEPNNIRAYKCKKKLLHNNALSLLKINKNYSIKRKHHQLNNLTN